MKSNRNNNNNGHEKVIELMSQNVIPQNHLDHNENANYIKAADVAAVLAAEITEAPTIQMMDGAVDTSTLHDSNELPNIARHLTWHDAFYENSTDIDDIIVAFDIDRTKYDIYDKLFWSQIFGIWFLSCIITSAYRFDIFVTGIVWSFAPIFFALVSFAYIWDTDKRCKQYRVKRLHVALTRNDVYIDLVDKPCGHNIKFRKKIPYDQIRNCVVKGEPSCWGKAMNFQISLQMKGEEYIIDGIASPQRFVDVVNAMINKSSEATTGVSTPDASTQV
jgi:hypothetical protein